MSTILEQHPPPLRSRRRKSTAIPPIPQLKQFENFSASPAIAGIHSSEPQPQSNTRWPIGPRAGHQSQSRTAPGRNFPLRWPAHGQGTMRTRRWAVRPDQGAPTASFIASRREIIWGRTTARSLRSPVLKSSCRSWSPTGSVAGHNATPVWRCPINGRIRLRLHGVTQHVHAHGQTQHQGPLGPAAWQVATTTMAQDTGALAGGGWIWSRLMAGGF